MQSQRKQDNHKDYGRERKSLDYKVQQKLIKMQKRLKTT